MKQDFDKMDKSVVSSSSSILHHYERRITRSTTKSARDSQGAVVGRNNNPQVISKKRKTRIEVPFLPEEIIFKIFLLLPAKLLHDVMRTVCRTWREVIKDPVFIKAHLSRSTTSPFCLFIYRSFFKIYLLKKDGTTWKFNKMINQVYLTHGAGFILTADRDDHSILYLVNPLTKQIITLPQLHIKYLVKSPNCAVSCSPLTLKYKVVFSKCPTTYILTVGDDKEWREILMELDTKFMWLHNLGHRGLIYWHNKYKVNYLIALDLENEVFYKFVIPKEFRGQPSWDMCSGMSLVVGYCSIANCMEFWELVDCKNGGEWRKFGIVDFESKRREIMEIMGVNSSSVLSFNIRPVVVLSRDVVVFRHIGQPYLLAYNFKMGTCSRCFDYLFHRSSNWALMIDNSLVVLLTDKSLLCLTISFSFLVDSLLILI